MRLSETDQKRIVREYLKLKQSDKSLTVNQIAEKLGTSDTSLFRMRKRFEKELLAAKIEDTEEDDDISEELINMVGEELGEKVEEEIVRGFVTAKDNDSVDAIPFEVSIPAGLTGKKRKIVLHYTVFDDLEIEEI